MKAPLVSIIIPVWNLWELTCACLDSIRAHTPGNAVEVIVVDNGSDDTTATALAPTGEGLFGARFRRIRLETNRGFAVACNLGAAKAQGTYLLLLNNDTVLSPGWLPPLLREFDDEPRTGAAGPLLVYPDSGRVQHCGIAFAPTLQTQHLYANFPATHPAVRARRTLQAITGAAMLLPTALFRQCGGFHEGYKNGCEDLELCCRIREQGLRLAVVPESLVAHHESRTPGRKEHDAANATLLNRRCSGCFGPDLHRHALRDGFAIALTPWLDTYLTLPPGREAALTREHITDFDPGRCWETLQGEPLWHGGYEMLCSILDEAGRHAESAGVRLLQAGFFPTLPGFRQLARSAALSGNDELARQAAEKMQHIGGILEDPEPLVTRARGLVRWARRAGEPAVEALYTGWLTDIGLSADD